MVKIGPLCRSSSRAVDGPVKKALLIGINYTNAPSHPEYTPLCHAQGDTREFAELLISKYGYVRDDIVVLLDEDEGDPRSAPTRDNIIREIRRLVHGARSGDHFVFYYSGHSGQIESPTTEEDDGMDEYLVPVDYWQHPERELKKRMILDNKLRKMLVNTLPVDANLTAIFDSCHSGTLLDLDHYLCNNVYFPWISPGFRKQKTLWRHVRRKDGQHMSQAGVKVITKKHARQKQNSAPSPATRRSSTSSVRIYQRKRLNENETFAVNTLVGVSDDGKARRFSIHSQAPAVDRRTSSILSQLYGGRLSLEIIGQIPETTGDVEPPVLCASPTTMSACNGFCQKPDQPPEGPNVISISACGDAQMTWDSRNHSFTRALIQLLRLEPHQPLGHLIRTLTFDLYEHSRKLHNWSKRRREAWKSRMKGGAAEPVGAADSPEPTLELENFTEPHVGSLRTLTMAEPFDP